MLIPGIAELWECKEDEERDGILEMRCEAVSWSVE
jgi:hypothetical protein